MLSAAIGVYVAIGWLLGLLAFGMACRRCVAAMAIGRRVVEFALIVAFWLPLLIGGVLIACLKTIDRCPSSHAEGM
jgi:hypothetical protein